MTDPDAAYRIDKRLARQAFDGAAIRYDEAAVLQREVGTRLLERLDVIRLAPNVVCDVGCGTGVATRELMRRFRRARIIGLDLAPSMLKIARGRAPALRKLRVVCADAESLPFADGCCDLVFSNMTLQWCQNLDRAFAEIRRVLRPGGLLLFSTLGPDTLKELRASWARVDRHSHVNAFVDMHDVGDSMVRAGLRDPVLDMEPFTLTYRDVIRLMRDLKTMGAHNVLHGRATGLTGKGQFRAVCDAYESFRQEGLLPATYEVVYGHAWGALARDNVARPDGSVAVPLAALRSRRADP